MLRMGCHQLLAGCHRRRVIALSLPRRSFPFVHGLRTPCTLLHELIAEAQDSGVRGRQCALELGSAPPNLRPVVAHRRELGPQLVPLPRELLQCGLAIAQLAPQKLHLSFSVSWRGKTVMALLLGLHCHATPRPYGAPALGSKGGRGDLRFHHRATAAVREPALAVDTSL